MGNRGLKIVRQQFSCKSSQGARYVCSMYWRSLVEILVEVPMKGLPFSIPIIIRQVHV